MTRQQPASTRSESKSIEDTRPTRRRRRLRNWSIGIAATVLLYTLIGFFGVPALIKHVVVPQVGKHLNGSIALSKAEFNPYTLELKLDGLEVKDDRGERTAAFDSFETDFQLIDTLFKDGVHFDRLMVARPFFRAEILADGALNLQRLIKPSASPATPSSSKPMKRFPRYVIREIIIDDGNALFKDQTTPEPFELDLIGLEFKIDAFDTRPDNRNPHRLAASASTGASLVWEGEVLADPLSSTGRFELKDWRIARFMPYGARYTDARITDGLFSAVLTYDFAPAKNPRRALIQIESAGITGLKIEHQKQPLIEAAKASIGDAVVDADARSLKVGIVDVNGGKAYARRDPEGVLEIVRLLPQPSGTDDAAARPPGGSASPVAQRIDPTTIEDPVEQIAVALRQLLEDVLGDWSIDVEKVRIVETGAEWLDAGARSPVEVSIKDITLAAGPIRSIEDYAVPLELSARFDDPGTFTAQGVIGTIVHRAQLTVKGENLALGAIEPYLPQKLADELPPTKLAAGVLGLDGNVDATMSSAGALRAKWTGAISLADARIDNADSGQALLTLSSLALGGDTQASVDEHGAARIDWNGELTLGGVAIDAPLADPVKLALGTMSAAGSLTANGGTDTGASGIFEGAVTLGQIAAETTRDGAPVKASVEKLAIEGKAETGSSAASGSLVFQGKADVDSASVELVQPIEVSGLIAKLTSTGVALDTGRELLTVDSVAIDQPKVSASLPLLPPPSDPGSKDDAADESDTKREPPRLPPPPYSVSIGEFNVTGGMIQINDAAAQPPIALTIDEVDIEASSISTDGGSMAEFTIESRLQESGKARITGKANAFADSPSADVVVDLASLPIKPYDPFVGRYIGYLVESGRMNLKLPITMQDNKVKGEIDADFEQFFLGDSTGSPDAIDAPVKLGLDLMRDLEKNIDMQIPFEGDMTDPKFSLGGIIVKAFVNIIIGAATAPFQLLGAVFGAAEGQDISFVEFEPGLAELAPSALSKVDVLAKALNERTALNLIIVGRTAEKEDMTALRMIALRDQMRARAGISDAGAPFRDDQYASQVEQAWREATSGAGATPSQGQGAPDLAAMEILLIEGIVPPPEQVAALAKARAEAVLAVLTGDHAITPERISIREPGPDEEDQAKDRGPRADFEIK